MDSRLRLEERPTINKPHTNEVILGNKRTIYDGCADGSLIDAIKHCGETMKYIGTINGKHGWWHNGSKNLNDKTYHYFAFKFPAHFSQYRKTELNKIVKEHLGN